MLEVDQRIEEAWKEGYDEGFKDGTKSEIREDVENEEDPIVLVPAYSNIVELREVLIALEPLRMSNAIAQSIISVISV